MRKSDRKEIEGLHFEVTQLGFAKSRQVFVRLSKALGPALAAFLDGKQSLASVDLRGALVDLLDRLSEADLVAVSDALMTDAKVSRDGTKWPFLKDQAEEIFAGRMLTYFQWLAFALEVNYSDFFGALRGLAGPAQGASTPESSEG